MNYPTVRGHGVLEIYRITLLSNRVQYDDQVGIVLEIYRITLLSNVMSVNRGIKKVLEIYRITLLSNTHDS